MEQYEAWGAKRKAAHLKSRYPGLISDDHTEAASPSANLDLATMLKASKAISSTLELEPLLEILLGILMENAGAQTATLLLETDGRSLIAARGSTEQVECFLPLSLPVEKAQSLSLSVISRVKQTREHLVLDNASREERFVEDDYIKRERPKSILCAPIHHKSALSGIIYLENNLLEGAFTSRRFEVIKHLSSQIAISLENARLHENLKKALDELKESETSLREENVRLKANIKERYRFGKINGKSPVMQEIYELILKAAASDVGVIVYGESGTDKELVAEAIHEMSDRKENPFVPVNLGGVAETLLESEFFGYKKGAFTGANADKRGLLHLADKGTLFLDELGEIGPNLQAKLLRAIEGGGFTPVGGLKAETSDYRIIAATNKDLKQQVKKGLMREDFFYRIHIIPIHLLPLRERKEDIPLLIEHFMQNHSPSKNLPKITVAVMEALTSYDWPGNVRELINTMHRYLTLKKLDFLDTSLVYDSKTEPMVSIESETNELLDATMKRFEKLYLTRVLEDNDWQQSKVSALLGVDLKTLYRKIKQYHLKPS